jgi:arginine decarboxylase
MNNSYLDLVNQTFNFPQEDYNLKDEYLEYNGVDVKALIDKYGTPLKFTYLPKIGIQINKAKKMFANAFKKHKYEGKYFYSYCTKSSHFSFIVEEALKHNIHLETSYAYDIEIINKLYEGKKITKDIFIICNGFKQKPYISRIARLLNTGFKNVIPVLDNKDELKAFRKSVRVPFKIGIRVAAEE